MSTWSLEIHFTLWTKLYDRLAVRVSLFMQHLSEVPRNIHVHVLSQFTIRLPDYFWWCGYTSTDECAKARSRGLKNLQGKYFEHALRDETDDWNWFHTHATLLVPQIQHIPRLQVYLLYKKLSTDSLLFIVRFKQSVGAQLVTSSFSAVRLPHHIGRISGPRWCTEI